MKHSLFRGISAWSLSLLLIFSAHASEPKTVLELKQATDTYFRNKNWTPFAASIRLSFYQQDEVKSHCYGTLLYDPLKKKLLMECFNGAGTPVFVFKNVDLNFLLYLPGIRKAWQGNIFELEYSLDFASHLRPLDLYRAVSPEAFSENQAVSAQGVSDGMEIEIAKPYQNRMYLARRLILNEKGQVKSEAFLTPDGAETTVVTREEFKKMKNQWDWISAQFFYAPQTAVIHPENGDKTLMEMKNLTLHGALPDEAWAVKIP